MARLVPHLLSAARLSLMTALWCWLLTALHAIWKFGVVEGFLELGEISFPSTIPITYLSFFMFTFGAFGITFMVAFALCAVTPPRGRLIALCVAWLIGGAIAAVDVSFIFLDHGGGTWLPQEAFWARFYHPIVTPFWIGFGLAGTASLTRSLRRAT